MNKIDERRYEINNRKLEIRSLLEGADEVNLDELESELRNLDTELANIEKRSAIVGNLKTIEKPENRKDDSIMNFDFDKDTVTGTEEYRSAFFKTLQGKKLSEAEERAYSTPTVAGSIPTTTASTLIKKMKTIAPLLDEITLLNATGNITFGVEGANNSASIAGENVELVDSGDTLVYVTVSGYDITKMIQISKAASTMTVPEMEDWIVDILAESLALKLEYYLINGSGTAMPQGVLGITYVEGTSLLSVAGSPTLTNLYDFTGMLPSGYDKNAKMLMRKQTLHNYFFVFRDDSTFPALNYVDGKYYLLGYEVMLSDNIATGIVVLGNFKKLVGNFNQQVVIESEYSATGRKTSYVGSSIFDSKVAISEAFVKMAITA